MSKQLNVLSSSSAFLKIRSTVFSFFKQAKQPKLMFLKDLLSIEYLLNQKGNVFFKPFLNSNCKQTMYQNLVQMLMSTRSFKKRNNSRCTFYYKFNDKTYSLTFSSRKKNSSLLKMYIPLFKNTLKKLIVITNYILKNQDRHFRFSNSIFMNSTERRELQDKQKLRLQKYAILKINTHFSNLSISLTTLTGQILVWKNGGCLPGETKRTRMTPRAVGNLMHLFLISLKKNKRLKQRKIRFLKIQFIGPSKKYRRKLIRMISQRALRLKMSVLCWEEAFHRSFNGCRLHRRKR